MFPTYDKPIQWLAIFIVYMFALMFLVEIVGLSSAAQNLVWLIGVILYMFIFPLREKPVHGKRNYKKYTYSKYGRKKRKSRL
tara:strand:+ start:275 stop:520 length:246 start_codon:yes stop_codon:yes gene_type:complete